MIMLRIIGTVALLMVSGELPALAQAAVQEQSAYAFYQPNAGVLNAGPPSVRSIYPMSAFASSAFYPRLRTLSRHHEQPHWIPGRPTTYVLRLKKESFC
jgi:hypothetical protein